MIISIDPIGKTVRHEGKQYTITGVAKDMVSNSPYYPVQPRDLDGRRWPWRLYGFELFLGSLGHVKNAPKVGQSSPGSNLITEDLFLVDKFQLVLR